MLTNAIAVAAAALLVLALSSMHNWCFSQNPQTMPNIVLFSLLFLSRPFISIFLFILENIL
jgi:hypothetical protein